MKLLFLHLSDSHFTQKSDYDFSHITSITNVLNEFPNSDDIVLIHSGDISNEGNDSQIDVGRLFLEELISNIKKTKHLKSNIKLFIVPGNHDIQLDKNLNHEKVRKLIENNREISQTLLSSEIEKLSSFFKLANEYECFNKSDKLFDRKILEYGKYKIAIDLVNSSLFSVKDSDNKGIHYLPNRVLSNIENDSNANLVVTIMHHSYHYFKNEIKNRLEQAILQNSSIAFFGHEHFRSSQNIEYNMQESTLICAGGALCSKGDWSESEFNVVLINTDTNESNVNSFIWDSHEKIYTNKQLQKNKIVKNPITNRMLTPTVEFMKDFREDKTNHIGSDFLQYFVFPRLNREELKSIPSKEILDDEVFLIDINEKKRILVVGSDNSGKSTLLKFMFDKLNKIGTAILCKGSDFGTANVKLMIKHMFERVYGTEPEKYNRFQQLPKEKRFILIDDIDKLDENFFNETISEIEKEFDIIILSSRKVFEVDIIARTKKIFTSEGKFFRYIIQPFYSDKRTALISKIVENKVNKGVDDQSEITKLLVQSLSRQKKLFNLDPSFIIQFTEYFCNNVHAAKHNDGEVFGKVFEANLVKSIEPHAKRINVDKFFYILDKIAYYIFKERTKSYPISENQIHEIITKYNEVYGNLVKTTDFLNIALKSSVLAINETGKYIFTNKNVLAYFIAREIRRIFQDENKYLDLEYLLNYSCFEFNADILMFLTYITENKRMLDSILETAVEFMKNWTEFSLDEINVQYLKESGVKEKVRRNKITIEQKEANTVELEKKQYEQNHNSEVAYLSYREEEVNLVNNQMLRSIWLLNIIARCLPNFEHMMLKDKKQLFVEMIYKIPNMIFYSWADLVDKHKVEIASEIMSIIEKQSAFEKKDHVINTPDFPEILNVLKGQSLNFYLEILNISVNNSTRENSIPYLKLFPYGSASSYHLQHIMSLSDIGDYKNFEREARLLFEKNISPISRYLVRQVVNNTLNNTLDIDFQAVQRLENFYFPSESNTFYKSNNFHKRLVLNQAKVKRKNK